MHHLKINNRHIQSWPDHSIFAGSQGFIQWGEASPPQKKKREKESGERERERREKRREEKRERGRGSDGEMQTERTTATIIIARETQKTLDT